MNETTQKNAEALTDEELDNVTGGYLYYDPQMKKWCALTNGGGLKASCDTREEAEWYIKACNLSDRVLTDDEYRNLIETGDPDNYPE